MNSTDPVTGAVREEGPEVVGSGAEFDHGQISVWEIETPPENDAVYGRISPEDPDVQVLAKDIARNGILEPLVITEDHYVLSGNRRMVAARAAGLATVPCRVEKVRRGSPEFTRLLVSFNQQRVKRLDQLARELAVTVDPGTAHRRLVEARREESEVSVEILNLGRVRGRSAIQGNRPLADAALAAAAALRSYWPLSDRQLHYHLLNDPPRLHAGKRTRYSNTPACYRTLTNVLARLRVAAELPFEAIADETRPVSLWRTHAHAGAYLSGELDRFLKGYWRDVLQSQANHVEVVVEKLTLQSILAPVASRFTLPMTVGRGFASLPPRWKIAQRYRKSGKAKLVLIILSDLDPAGMTIAESFGRSLRDDFGIPECDLVCHKAALTIEQVEALNLPPRMEVKMSASTAAEYVRRYGRYVWELEAVPPPKLQEILRGAISSVLDLDRLNAERRQEQQDAATLHGWRRAVLSHFSTLSSGPTAATGKDGPQ
jgi:hypothetical protein